MLENAHQGYALKMILEVYLLDFYLAFMIENREDLELKNEAPHTSQL